MATHQYIIEFVKVVEKYMLDSTNTFT